VTDIIDDKVELEDAPEQEDEEIEEKEKLQKLLSGVNDSILFANVTAQNLLMSSMSLSMNLNPYYDKKIAGGEYKDKVVINGGELPDNKKGARSGLAQQLLHTKMVSLQYDKQE
jgi:hypothetical protein